MRKFFCYKSFPFVQSRVFVCKQYIFNLQVYDNEENFVIACKWYLKEIIFRYAKRPQMNITMYILFLAITSQLYPSSLSLVIVTWLANRIASNTMRNKWDGTRSLLPVWNMLFALIFVPTTRGRFAYVWLSIHMLSILERFLHSTFLADYMDQMLSLQFHSNIQQKCIYAMYNCV